MKIEWLNGIVKDLDTILAEIDKENQKVKKE